MSSDRKSSFAKDPENARPEKNDPHTGGGGAVQLGVPHFDKASAKNRIEPVSNPGPSGGHVRPEKAAAVAGDKTQTAGLSQPHGGDEPIPTEQLHLDKHKDHKNRTHEPKPGHTPNDYGKGEPSKYPDGSSSTKVG
jgi:hypothetical protein